MGIRKFFHKLKIGFLRLCAPEPVIPYKSEAKRYGDFGETEFLNNIQRLLPDCKIKKNIVIQMAEGNAEIDCLILYKNKLFAVEIKRWKGKLIEQNGKFTKDKYDRWTDEIHTEIYKSPFKQLSRAVYLLKKQIPDNVWINNIVFFE